MTENNIICAIVIFENIINEYLVINLELIGNSRCFKQISMIGNKRWKIL